MKFTITSISETSIGIAIEGRLDAHQATTLRETFLRLESEGVHRFELCLTDVVFMDSAGLAAIITGLKIARKYGEELVLVDPSQPVRQVLSYTMLDRVIPMREGNVSAVAQGA